MPLLQTILWMRTQFCFLLHKVIDENAMNMLVTSSECGKGFFIPIEANLLRQGSKVFQPVIVLISYCVSSTTKNSK